MIGTSRIAGGRADAAIPLVNQGRVVQIFVRRVAPDLATDALVQTFCKGLGQPVCQSFGQDRVVVILVRLELPYQFIETVSGGDGKGAEVVWTTTVRGSHEIGKTAIGPTFRLAGLLAKEVKDRQDSLALLIPVKFHVVAAGVGRKEPEDRLGLKEPTLDDPAKQHLCVVEETPCLCADRRVLEDGRILAGQFPGLEERRPVYVATQLLQIVIVQLLDSYPAGLLGRILRPVPRPAILPGRGNRQQVRAFRRMLSPPD